MILWQLFISYLKIGFFGFGGGYAMLSLIQNEVVVQHQWMTNAQFADIVAVCLPSLTLMILVARFFMRLKHNRLVEGAMRGMRPAVIGMIAAAALLLIFPHSDAPGDQNFIDAWSWVLFGGVFAGSWRKVNPILLIVLSAVAGILIYYVFGL